MSTCGIRDRRHSGLTDVGLRLAGLSALAVGSASVHALLRLHAAAPHAHAGIASCLAALCFAGGSIGSALVTLGHHIFDEVEISARWACKLPRQASRPEQRAASDWLPGDTLSSNQGHYGEALAPLAPFIAY